jgi:hypothetical protein
MLSLDLLRWEFLHTLHSQLILLYLISFFCL